MVETVEKRYAGAIAKVDAEKRLVYGIVLEPDTVDSQGDVVPADEIERAAHNFMQRSRLIGLQHKRAAPAVPVESYIVQSDHEIGGERVRKGTWVMVVKVLDEELWKQVKAGEITGFSIGGTGVRMTEEA